MMQKKLVPNYETFDDSFVFTGVQIGKRTAFGSWKAPDNGKPLLYSSLGTASTTGPNTIPSCLMQSGIWISMCLPPSAPSTRPA